MHSPRQAVSGAGVPRGRVRGGAGAGAPCVRRSGSASRQKEAGAGLGWARGLVLRWRVPPLLRRWLRSAPLPALFSSAGTGGGCHVAARPGPAPAGGWMRCRRRRSGREALSRRPRVPRGEGGGCLAPARLAATCEDAAPGPGGLLCRASRSRDGPCGPGCPGKTWKPVSSVEGGWRGRKPESGEALR